MTEFWRFITYCFLHENEVHLWFNMAMQFIFGVCFEMTNSSFKASLIYFLGVVGGSMAFALIDPGETLVGKTQLKEIQIICSIALGCIHLLNTCKYCDNTRRVL